MNFVNGKESYVKLPIAIIMKEENTYEFRLNMQGFKDIYTPYSYPEKVEDKGHSIDFIFDDGHGRLFTCLEMNQL